MSDKTARNDVTGDFIRSKPANDMFEENFDRIFRKKKEESRIDVVGQNGNEGLHYEYELNKSTGEVQKKED
jgi:hypothetical protein